MNSDSEFKKKKKGKGKGKVKGGKKDVRKLLQNAKPSN
jgi:hypothetical protein